MPEFYPDEESIQKTSTTTSKVPEESEEMKIDEEFTESLNDGLEMEQTEINELNSSSELVKLESIEENFIEEEI